MIRQKLQESMSSEPSYQNHFPQARVHKALGISQGKGLPVFLPLELHTQPCVALEEVTWGLQ